MSAPLLYVAGLQNQLDGVRDSRDKRCLPVSQEISNSVSKVAEGPVQIPHLHH